MEVEEVELQKRAAEMETGMDVSKAKTIACVLIVIVVAGSVVADYGRSTWSIIFAGKLRVIIKVRI